MVDIDFAYNLFPSAVDVFQKLKSDPNEIIIPPWRELNYYG